MSKTKLLVAGFIAGLFYSSAANSHPIPTKDGILGCPLDLIGITFHPLRGCVHEPHIQHYPTSFGDSAFCDYYWGGTCYKGKGIVPPISPKDQKIIDKAFQDGLDCVTKGINCPKINVGKRSSKGTLVGSPLRYIVFAGEGFKLNSKDEINEFWARTAVVLFQDPGNIRYEDYTRKWALIRVVNRNIPDDSTKDYKEGLVEVNCRGYNEFAIRNKSGIKHLEKYLNDSTLSSIAIQMCRQSQPGLTTFRNTRRRDSISWEYIFTSYKQKSMMFANIQPRRNNPETYIVGLSIVDGYNKQLPELLNQIFLFDCRRKKYQAYKDVWDIPRGSVSTEGFQEIIPGSVTDLVCKKAIF